MDEATAQALAAINRRFYAEHAEDFDRTRTLAWPGWTRLLPWLGPLCADAPLRVLDVGCGNGRLASHLASNGLACAYTGVDGCAALLAAGRARAVPGARFESCEFVTTPSSLPPGPFDFAACFGVLHEVPGHERRRALVEALVARLCPGGVLALARWRFGEVERFRRRIRPWADWNRTASTPIDPGALEPGDHLLPWGDGSAARYAHALTAADLDRLVAGLPLAPLGRFTDDGRSGDLNEYAVFRAPAAGGSLAASAARR